jgi:hypothetical protein
LHKGSVSQGQRESGNQEEDSASGSHFLLAATATKTKLAGFLLPYMDLSSNYFMRTKLEYECLANIVDELGAIVSSSDDVKFLSSS